MSIFKAISNAMTPTLRAFLIVAIIFIGAVALSSLIACQAPQVCKHCWVSG